MSPNSARVFPDDWLNPLPVAELFSRPAPLEVDLGCGKGRFLLAHAAAHPDVNFLGVDRMLRRIRKVDRKANRLGLTNVRLLRMEGYYTTVYLLPPASVRCYYIFFPDPWPKKRHHKNRLFNDRFMNALVHTLAPCGTVHLATDHAAYFEEIQSLWSADARFRRTESFVPREEERTDFELLFQERAIIHRSSVTRS